MTPPLIDPALRSCADTLDAIAHPPTATITPREPAESVAQRLHTLRSLCQGPAGGGVRLRGRLGQGGMGEVLLAEQVSMGRKVAVKRLKREATTEANTIKLLQEAWVTGYMEHPNIIPVYDITVDESGHAAHPAHAHRRGTQWGHLMDDPETVRERFNNSDLLEWNLRVLMQVCDAVHFAHTRGIIHRDLKPENIMIGELGEVYVVDWGIAVSCASSTPAACRSRGTPRRWRARPATWPRDAGRGEQHAQRAHRRVPAGRHALRDAGRHGAAQRQEAADIIASIISSPPPIPDDVPHELGRICTAGHGR
jgi:serine/threonine protein kinase